MDEGFGDGLKSPILWIYRVMLVATWAQVRGPCRCFIKRLGGGDGLVLWSFGWRGVGSLGQ
jgi:hypothetical protein